MRHDLSVTFRRDKSTLNFKHHPYEYNNYTLLSNLSTLETL